MDRKWREVLMARAAITKALAYPTRLFVVDELSHGFTLSRPCVMSMFPVSEKYSRSGTGKALLGGRRKKEKTQDSAKPQDDV